MEVEVGSRAVDPEVLLAVGPEPFALPPKVALSPSVVSIRPPYVTLQPSVLPGMSQVFVAVAPARSRPGPSPSRDHEAAPTMPKRSMASFGVS
jgi:hypothetical protein